MCGIYKIISSSRFKNDKYIIKSMHKLVNYNKPINIHKHNECTT